MQHTRPRTIECSAKSQVGRSSYTCVVVMLVGLLPIACAPVAEDLDAVRPEARISLEQKAIDRVLVALRSEDAFLRANAIEAAAFLPKRAESLVRIGLEDKSAVVRFASLATVGRLKLRRLLATARRLSTDPDESVQAAALFALSQCGQRVDLSPMAALLASDEPTTRGNVAMLMGLSGDPSAIPLLKEVARVRLKKANPQRAAVIRLQIAEAVVRLGDEESIDAIEAAAFSQFDEVRVLAVLTLGRLNDRQVEPALAGMLNQPPIELQLAAAQALAMMDRRGRGLEMVLQAADSQVTTIRAQTAIVLGHFQDPKATDRLAVMLDDQQAQVRIAAAAAVLRRARPDADTGDSAASGAGS